MLWGGVGLGCSEIGVWMGLREDVGALKGESIATD